MKTIFRVAKTELLTLFYSPIAWFLMIVFLIQCGIVYTGQLEGIARQQEMGGWSLLYLNQLTERIFLAPGGLFNGVMQNLYLYIPLLTMSLISRETSSGTIKLLYSSPVSIRQIVFGKFLSMMVYSLVLLAIIGIFAVSGLFHVQFPDKGMLITAMLGFYLLLCAYAAIGLFMSCLTTYQVVAAICTFVMIGVLSYIGTLWQDIAFVRELTYFLSINGRTQKMLSGLVTTKDLIYFIVIIYIFLGLSVYKLRAGMESKSGIIKTLRYMSVIVSALIIGYITSIPDLIGYYDATANRSRTLTPNAQKILAELGGDPLEVTAYNNLLGSYWYLGAPTSYNQNLARWEPYIRFKHDIQLNTVRYYDSALDNRSMLNAYPGKTLKEVAEQYAKSMNIKLAGIKTPEEIHRIIDLRPENNRYVMQLKWRGRTTFLRVFDDQMLWPSETEVLAALKRLLKAKLPKIAFLTGDLERAIYKMGDKDYKVVTNLNTFRNSLVNQGFDVDSVSLETREVPADISILVIADPKIAFGQLTLNRLQQYIDKGGNLLIAGEPRKQSILNPLLQKLGVQITDGVVIQESKEFSPDLVTSDLSGFAGTFSKPLAKSVADSQKISMPGTAGLSYTTGGDFTIQPLLATDAKLTWNRLQPLDPDLFTNASVSRAPVQLYGDSPAATKRSTAGTVTFSVSDGDKKGPLTTAVSLTRNINGKQQRIVVTGDADFMSNNELRRNTMTTANFVFNTALFSWLSYKEFPIDTSRPDAKDKRVNVTLDQVDFLKIIYLWVLPGLLFIMAAILLIRRKRK